MESIHRRYLKKFHSWEEGEDVEIHDGSGGPPRAAVVKENFDARGKKDLSELLVKVAWTSSGSTAVAFKRVAGRKDEAQGKPEEAEVAPPRAQAKRRAAVIEVVDDDGVESGGGAAENVVKRTRFAGPRISTRYSRQNPKPAMTRRHCDAVTRLRVASFNIRMETSEPDPMDRVWRVGEVGKKWCTLEVVEWRKQDNWSKRKRAVLTALVDSGADILGLQEVKPDQLQFLVSSLQSHGYQHVGVGRGKDGDDEASPIFFKEDVFDLLKHDQRWLCETPSVPGSKLLDAGCPRIVTAALLETKASQERFFAFCCHLDHRGMDRAALPFSAGLQIQAKQAEILLDQVDAFCDVSSSTSELGVAVAPRVILGDFNSWRNAGAHLEASSDSSKSWIDGQPTFTGFRSGPLWRRLLERFLSVQIDWIFAKGHVTLSKYEVGPGSYMASDGRTRNLSDHLMIAADVCLQPDAA
ncbi:Endo/exonuclease/phosphatase domain-containing protein [Durusdinium trenchii]|uniref:Endo/exonuclease/phosphatase domain-containing protein n=1 Tax=Durusdinium trenchii TaxID=1381693 RepID=A0ABP0IG06_9DINO